MSEGESGPNNELAPALRIESPSRSDGRPPWALLVPILTAAVFLPSLDNGFVNWDDDKYIQENTTLFLPKGLATIWSGRHELQYYPLTLTSFWAEYRLWGNDAKGYHVTNVALHAANALLVVSVARALGMGLGASLVAGLLFGIHPIQVGSVSWASERKNVLAGFFYLLSFLAYRRFRAQGGRAVYAAGILAFAAALLSKTASVTLPAALWLADTIVDRRPPLRSLVPVLPMFALGVAAAAVTVHMEARATWTPEPFAVRPLIAVAAVWFYVGKILWPIPLVPVYPRWEVATSTPWLWASMLGFLIAAAVVFSQRRRLRSQVTWGLPAFVVGLAPMLGLLSFGYLEHAFVADHFVYFAAVGAFCAIAAALEPLLSRGREPFRRALPAVITVAALVALAALNVRQQGVWSGSMTLWRHTLRHNPRFALGHSNLGSAFFANGKFPEARRQFETALAINPRAAYAHLNLGLVCKQENDIDRAAKHFREAARLQPGAAAPHTMLGVVHFLRREYAEAISAFRQGAAMAPNDPTAAANLGRLLATCPIDSLRNGKEAVSFAWRACVLTRFGDPQMLSGLAAAMAEAGRYGDAVKVAARAAGLAGALGQHDLANALQEQSRLHEAGLPLRLPP